MDQEGSILSSSAPSIASHEQHRDSDSGGTYRRRIDVGAPLNDGATSRSFAKTFAKTVVIRWLSSLQAGQLVLEDAGERHVFGMPGRSASVDGSYDSTEVPIEQAHVRVVDRRFYGRVLFGGSMGAAESYLRGEWTTDDLVPVFQMLARNSSSLKNLERIATWLCAPLHWTRRWWTKNTFRGSRENIHAHYDLGNDFFRLFLDETMTYSSGVFSSPGTSLREASIEKYDRICRKLRLQPHHHLIEIGTGWGGFAIHAAKNYGCQITTTTISQEQFAYAQKAIAEAGVSDRVQVVCEDYRRLRGTFDRLVSIEMIEAVGAEFLPTYFRQCESLLQAGGEMVIQAITIPDQRFESYRRSQDFIQKYVFPGGCLPSLGAIAKAVAQTNDLQLIHLEDFAQDYATTLAHWRRRFLDRLDEVKTLGLDDRFVRLWDYYLSYCEAGFREQLTGVSQLHFRRAKGGG